MVLQVTQVDIHCRGMFKCITHSVRNLFSQDPPSFEISTPYNFQHIQHAEVDPQSPTGFVISLVIKTAGSPSKLCTKIFKPSSATYYLP